MIVNPGAGRINTDSTSTDGDSHFKMLGDIQNCDELSENFCVIFL